MALDIQRIPDAFYLGLFKSAGDIFAGAEQTQDSNGEIAKILAGRTPAGLTAGQTAQLLRLVRSSPSPDLRRQVLDASRSLRRKIFGSAVATMVPIEVTSFCASTCRFCGWRADNGDMVRLSITEAAIREQARILAKKGFSHFEIAGGDDLKLLQDHLPGLVAGLKEETRAINPEARVSICLVPMHEHNYRALKDKGLDCVLTWQETYCEELYNHHIPSGPKAWGVDGNLKLQKKSDRSAGFLHRMQSQELAIRAGLQAGMGAMIGLAKVTEADILSVVMHGRKLIDTYGDEVAPLIVGMPAWNAILTTGTDNRSSDEFDFDTEGNFELIAAIYLLAFPDRRAWIFANGRVPPDIQTNCVETASCFTSTLVKIAPGAYLDLSDGVPDGMFERTRGVAVKDLTPEKVLSGEQFMHYFDSHENFVGYFEGRGMNVVSCRSLLPIEALAPA